MVWFVIAIILLLIGVGAVAVALAGGGAGAGLGFIPIVVAGLLMIPACLYSQDAGEVVVLKNMGGSIAGYSADAGFHGKLPWQSTMQYDTRNNVISYVAKGEEDYDGGSARGPQVTVNDKNGAQADIDIQVNYSLDPKYAMDLYKDYGKQTTFVKSVAAVDVRSVPREVSGQFDTIQLLTDRSKYTAAIQKALTAKWKDMGLRVEQVSVQEIRYPKSITSKYAEAQAAEIDKQKALNEQEVEKTKAETKRIKAQGEADANKVLNDSLTDNVLRQHYIDALQNADQLVVTPRGIQHPHPTQVSQTMNAKDYGHHFSGYRRSDECEPSQGFMHRLVLWIVAYAVCVGWMMTHMGCAHPIENGIAALIGFGFVPLRLIDLVLSEAGVEYE